MSDKTTLGDRMKRYERTHRHTLTPNMLSIVRVDGRAFHSLLKGAERPFDYKFMSCMDMVAEALCKEISGAVMAYTQSDEVSVLMYDFERFATEGWFGGVEAKVVSLSAAVATLEFNRCWERPGLFDARVFTLPNPVEVANYFIWRQRDAVRNSIAMAAQSMFSHQELHGVGVNQMQERMWNRHGVNWNDYPGGAKRGRWTVKEPYTDSIDGPDGPIPIPRSRWTTDAAPHFVAEAGTLLADLIPQPASFTTP